MSSATFDPDAPVLSYSPVTFQIPGRPVSLQVRVTAPAAGGNLPVILLSHGHGASNNLSSLNGYAPLVNQWAAAGFVVIQPTHLSSRTLAAKLSDAPGAPFFWQSRATDMSHILDHLGEIENEVPQLAGRLHRDNVAVSGHSLGGFTAGLLLGATVTDPDTGEVVSFLEPRIKQGVLLAAPGRGGEDVLTGWMAAQVPFFHGIDFSTMATPALVVAGDKDDSQHFTSVGPDWHADPYRLAPAPKALLTVFGAEHLLGGISGYDAQETSDENPERVAAVARLSAAYLHSQFRPGSLTWEAACAELAAGTAPLAGVESK
ncbi:alpha/beta hydrolase family protein [Streptomyces sp. YJ-C3]